MSYAHCTEIYDKVYECVLCALSIHWVLKSHETESVKNNAKCIFLCLSMFPSPWSLVFLGVSGLSTYQVRPNSMCVQWQPVLQATLYKVSIQSTLSKYKLLLLMRLYGFAAVFVYPYVSDYFFSLPLTAATHSKQTELPALNFKCILTCWNVVWITHFNCRLKIISKRIISIQFQFRQAVVLERIQRTRTYTQ